MKQRIVHGAQIEAATPQEIGAILAKAQEHQVIRQFERKKGVIPLDATGAGSFQIPLPSEYDWIMERVTVAVTPAATALVTLYENQQALADLLEVVALPASGLYSDGFANRLYVSANSQLLIVCAAGPVNGAATFNLQVQLQKRPSRGVQA